MQRYLRQVSATSLTWAMRLQNSQAHVICLLVCAQARAVISFILLLSM